MSNMENIQTHGQQMDTNDTVQLQDPEAVQAKGRPKNKRIKSIAEIKKIRESKETKG